MDEFFEKVQRMLAGAFEQGMAYQRMLDAQDDFEEGQKTVNDLWIELRSEFEPDEDEKVN